MPPLRLPSNSHARFHGTPLAALWRLRGYLRPYLWQLVCMFVAAFLSVGAEIVIPLLTKSLIDNGIGRHDRGLLVVLGLTATGLGAAQAGLNFGRRWVQASAVAGMEQAMRNDLYAHLERLDIAFHDEWQSGQLLSRATTDLSAIRRFAGFGVVFFITNVLTFITVVALLIRLNWWLGVVTGTVFLPVIWVCLWFERRYRVLSRLSQDQQGDLATYVEEAATGIAVLKALGRRAQAAARHGEQASLVYRTQLSKTALRGSFWSFLDLIPNVVIGIIVLLGAIATSHHALTLGGLVAFITLTLQVVWPIEAMGYILASGQEAATAAQRVLEIMDTEPAIVSPPAAQAPAPAAAASQPPAPPQAREAVPAPRPAPGDDSRPATDLPPPARPPAGRAAGPRPGAGAARLVFDGVGFTYPGSPHPVLRSVSLVVEPGETVALTGATGSGKTTLLHLVPRLADPTAGSITLDGEDIAAMPLPLLRSLVGCAFEDPTLFSASVRENVAFGVTGATEEEIEQSLAIAHAGFVRDLPWGLDTRIGEQGMSLSGGQRQRVALARAILARPPVLILDDPLSALDVRTEEKVTRELHRVLDGTTALIVAHRPSTVQLADRVALLDGGVIAAEGTHAELLAAQPRYRDLMSTPGSGGAQDSTDDSPQGGTNAEAVV